MIEYSNRYTDMYYAAKSGNWPLAAYQLKEAFEIQEVGETTRPAQRADALRAFEQAFLDPIGKAIQAKDFEQFDTLLQGWHARLQRVPCCLGFCLHRSPPIFPAALLPRSTMKP